MTCALILIVTFTCRVPRPRCVDWKVILIRFISDRADKSIDNTVQQILGCLKIQEQE